MTPAPSFDAILAALGGLDDDTRNEQLDAVNKLVAGMRWIPNPGPQTEAFFSAADELFYGGQAGGGKTDLAVGLALTQHSRSLILRRYRDDVKELSDRLLEIAGTRDGWNGADLIFREKNRTTRFGGCSTEEEKQRFKGKPNDLYVFDEVSDFTESIYTFIIAWNRSTTPGQRCRILAAGNPPTRPEGLWVLKRWAAWLDPAHPNPALPGELRWYTTSEDGIEIEVDGPGPHLIPGELQPVRARSRTFIPAALSDNPDLAGTGYDAALDALPAELRAAYRDGKFDTCLKDRAYQVIPTAWVKLAQDRWTEKPPTGVPLCAMGVDASGGSSDPMIIASRHDGWYARTIKVLAKEIPIERAGSYCAGIVMSHRRDDATVIIDLGGGYGSAMYEHLHANGVQPMGYKGAAEGYGKTMCGKFGFNNARSAAIWRFREALDPGQPGGSPIMLPPSPTLLADLTAPTYEPDSKMIVVESKKKVCERLGRSTDEGDAVVMAWTKGLKQFNVIGGFKGYNARKMPQVQAGRSAQNAQRRSK